MGARTAIRAIVTGGALLPFLVATGSGAPSAARPARDPGIMSFEEYQSGRHSDPHVYRIETGAGALLYFGSRHGFDPADPQLQQLEDAWHDFHPDVAYTEGGDLSIESLTREQAVERYGEFGETWWLARADDVPVRSLDPDRASEIAWLKGKGWDGEKLMLFYTLRKAAQSREQRFRVDLAEVAPRYLASLAERFDLQGPTTLAALEEAVGRLLPDVDDWKAVSMSLFYPGPQDPSFFTNEIATDSNRFRDRHHVELLTEAVRSGRRVFAVCGSAHAVMQEPALRSALRPSPRAAEGE